MVLVPGLGLDQRSSARVRARLQERVPTGVVHLPGLGRRSPVPPDLDALAAQLCAALGHGPVLLVGHSQSCQVVVAAAGDPRVVGVLLLGPTTDPRLRRPGVLAARWLRTAVREPLWQVPLVLAQWLRVGPRAMTALWRVAAPDRLDVRLAAVPVPVVVVRGARDALCPHGWATRLAGCAPRGRLVELPGAAHMTVQTHPAAVVAVLEELLDELSGQG